MALCRVLRPSGVLAQEAESLLLFVPWFPLLYAAAAATGVVGVVAVVAVLEVEEETINPKPE